MNLKSIYTKSVLFLLASTILLNLLGLSKRFCDYYANHIYPIINNIEGRITSPIPFALGEILMYLAALMVLGVFIVLLLLIFLKGSTKYKHFTKNYFKVFGMTLLVFLFLYTTNWFIPFRANVLRVNDNKRTIYTYQEVCKVYNYIVDNLNRLAKELERDEDGFLIENYTIQDIENAMRAQSYRYPRLKGHYSKVKPAICSPLLELMRIGGYNYIYTMEPTYNIYSTPLALPVLLAHELAHHKGYYYENEGEFISCISLVESDNPYLQYCGYFQMYYFMYDTLSDATAKAISPDSPLGNADMAKWKVLMSAQPGLSKLVWADYDHARNVGEAFYQENKNEFIEKKLKKPAEKVAEVGWETQGNILGANSYDGLSLMLLQYYIPLLSQ